MKVLLVVIDGASPFVFCPAVRTGRLANLQRLADAGVMHQSSVSMFPSITPAATSSLVTGGYPAEHGIQGAAWLKDAEGNVAYYGDDFWVAAREGPGNFFRDFLVHLNGDRLRAPTLFDLIERTGRRAASLNYLVYRGLYAHRARLPRLLAALPGVPTEVTVHGPSTLGLGTLVDSQLWHGTIHGKGGPLHRFGMDDEGTGVQLCSLIEAGELPDFTVAYFADNDFQSHDVGPRDALPALDRVDGILGAAFDRAGGVERFLEGAAVIITSDHGHCDVLEDADRAVVRLDTVLDDVVRLAKLGLPWTNRDQAMICPNMRAAQIYFRTVSNDRRDLIIERLLEHPGVDQVMWRRDQQGCDGLSYSVASAKGRLQFKRCGNGSDCGSDAFGNRWQWSGDLDVLDMLADGPRLRYGVYPNAFERLEGALASAESGDLWITARPGCEFEAAGGKAHVGGGSHGALHELDSLSPVIVSGVPRGFRLPQDFRSVDIAPLCMQLLGIPMRYSVGEPRAPHRSPQPV
jgi:predicted AlkP superfamily pyrophosphatase or phosphodiesterase